MSCEGLEVGSGMKKRGSSLKEQLYTALEIRGNFHVIRPPGIGLISDPRLFVLVTAAQEMNLG